MQYTPCRNADSRSTLIHLKHVYTSVTCEYIQHSVNKCSLSYRYMYLVFASICIQLVSQHVWGVPECICLVICGIPLQRHFSNTFPKAAVTNDKIYELRTYAVHPKDVKAFVDLSKEWMHLRLSHSKLVGYWTAELGAGINDMVHIWEYGGCLDSLRQYTCSSNVGCLKP